MTRETKIGLLVGLAFIIVIGILLSDQLMRSTEPPPAPLAGVADTVRRATATPASATPTRPVEPIARATGPSDMQPEGTVPVREEVVSRPPPVTFVEIRPGNGGPAVVVPAGQAIRGNDVAGGQGQAGHVVVNQGNAGATGTVDVSRARTLADAAAAVGETLVGPDGQPLRPAGGIASSQTQNLTAGQNVRNPPAAGVAMKPYKAENGDNLAKLATRFFGSNSKAARDAILAANPSLAANPNQIIIGQTYNIPIIESAATQPPAPATPVVIRATGTSKNTPAAAENWYVVKDGDSLWKIAVEQCGNKNTVSAIKELNRENVKDWDRLRANTKIRLPVKAAGASARADR